MRADLVLTREKIEWKPNLHSNKRKMRVCSSNEHSFNIHLVCKFTGNCNAYESKQIQKRQSRRVSFDTTTNYCNANYFGDAFNTWFTKEMLCLFCVHTIRYMAVSFSYSVRHRAGVCVTKFKNNPHETRAAIYFVVYEIVSPLSLFGRRCNVWDTAMPSMRFKTLCTKITNQ